MKKKKGKLSCLPGFGNGFGAAGTSDDLNQTANYGTIYDIVAEITLSHKYDLIETLAERIAAAGVRGISQGGGRNCAGG